jgi:hypothetical protein
MTTTQRSSRHLAQSRDQWKLCSFVFLKKSLL